MISKSVFLGVLGAAVAIPMAGSMVSGSLRADKIEGAGDDVQNSDIPIDASHFPDSGFRNVIGQFDRNSDGKLSSSELKNATDLYCSEMGIKSVQGLEYFTSMEYLDLSNNELTELDVSKNTNLFYLDCSYNKIKKLDLSKNKKLSSLYCQGEVQTTYGEEIEDKVLGTLESIDISKCESLSNLVVSGNQLTNLDIRHNLSLIELNFDHNNLTSIDVSKHENLGSLNCGSNQLTSLDVTNNMHLSFLDFSQNKIKSIDVSDCIALQSLYAMHNQLTSLDISQNILLRVLMAHGNQISSLDISNTQINDVYDPAEVEDTGSAYIFSVDIDDTSFTIEYDKTTEIKYNKTPSFVCKIDKKTFPDDLFREYVSRFDMNKDGSFSRTEVNAILRIELIEEEWQQISSVKGIEYFYNLNTLQLDYTDIEELILGEHKALTTISINDDGEIDTGKNHGQLEKIDVSGCPNLKSLAVTFNPVKNVDLSKNTKLDSVIFMNCPLSKIDLSKNTEITYLCLTGAKFSKLDLSNNTKLTMLTLDICSKLPTIDLSKLSNLQYLSCGWMSLSGLDVSHCPKLETLLCYASGLKELDVSSNPKLKELECGENSITNLDLSHNPELLTLSYGFGALQNVDVTKCTKLQYLYLPVNNLKSLDVSKNTNLVSLISTGNPEIGKLDVSKCTKLETLACEFNGLKYLDTSNLTRLKELRCTGNEELAKLDLSACNLTVLECSMTSISSLDLSRHTNLTELGLQSLNLETLDLTNNTKLYFLSLADNLLSELDLSHQKAFEYIDLSLNMFAEKPKYKLRDEGFEEFEPQKCVAPVTGLKMVSRKGKEVTLAWDEVKNYSKPDFYEVYRSETKDGEFKRVAKVARNGKVDENTEPEKTYYYYVVGVRDMSNYIYFDDIYGEPSEIIEVKAGKSSEDPSDDPTFEDFVERLYTVALGRASEPEGKAYWIKQVVEEGKTGADCARFFLLDADEFMKRNLSVEDFVETLYATFFDRESDEAGKKGWVDAINSGKKTRADVVNDFIESTEWCNVCATYGVKSGALYHKATKASKNAINFATRLYTCCLKRDPEAEGIKYWSLALTNLEKTGASAAQFFFEGEEFVGLNTSDREYLMRLYTTFMDREPAEEEIQFWIGEMKVGKQTRSSILAFFAQSPEFTSICKKYGIDRGDLS